MLRIALITMFIAGIVVSSLYTEQIKKVITFSGQTLNSTPSSVGSQQSFYKWQDAQGQWHLSDNAPEGVKATQVHINTAANVIPSIHVADKKNETTTKKPESEPNSVPSVPMTVNPTQVHKLIDQAKDVEKLMQERQGYIDKALQ